MGKILLRTLALALLLLIGIGLYHYNQVERPQLVNTNGRTFQTAVVTRVLKDNLQENGSRIGDQLVLAKLDDTGEIVEANCPNGLLFGTICKPGLDIVIISSKATGSSLYTVYSIQRGKYIIGFILLFFGLLCLIGGKKGVKTTLAIIVTFICFVYIFFPMLMHGISPITAAIFTSTIVLTITIYLINGATIKALSAILSALLGVISAGLIAVLFGAIVNLSGYNVGNIESLMFIAQNTPINVAQLLFAGILFSSLGAVMDITMDISAALEELRQKNPMLSHKELFISGINIGREVMGTMSTTLILAFFGGSLGAWVLDYVYNLPYLQLINSNTICIQIMQGLSGSFGVILSVPLAAILAAYLPKTIENIAKRRVVIKEISTKVKGHEVK